MQLLLKRLEIVRAAMALEDESLLALQLPALQAALAQMDAATSAHAALAEIIRLLQGRQPLLLSKSFLQVVVAFLFLYLVFVATKVLAYVCLLSIE